MDPIDKFVDKFDLLHFVNKYFTHKGDILVIPEIDFNKQKIYIFNRQHTPDKWFISTRYIPFILNNYQVVWVWN